MQACVNALMIVARDFPSDPALQLPQRHPGCMCGPVFSPLGRVAEGRARQEGHRTHLRADQPLDVAAKVGRRDWTPDDPDPMIAASPLEGPAPEVRSIVSMQCLWQPGDGPRGFDVP